MSTTFHVLFAPSVARADAEAGEARVVGALQSIGLIGELEDRQVDAFGTTCRYPWSKASISLFDKTTPDPYGLGDYVESTVGNYANGWSLNSVSMFRCPSCAAQFDRDGQRPGFEGLVEGMVEAIGKFVESAEHTGIACPACGATPVASAWTADVPPAFAHLAFEFSEFPPFNTQAIQMPEWVFGYGLWRVDVPQVVEDALGHSLGWSMGRI